MHASSRSYPILTAAFGNWSNRLAPGGARPQAAPSHPSLDSGASSSGTREPPSTQRRLPQAPTALGPAGPGRRMGGGLERGRPHPRELPQPPLSPPSAPRRREHGRPHPLPRRSGQPQPHAKCGGSQERWVRRRAGRSGTVPLAHRPLRCSPSAPLRRRGSGKKGTDTPVTHQLLDGGSASSPSAIAVDVPPRSAVKRGRVVCVFCCVFFFILTLHLSMSRPCSSSLPCCREVRASTAKRGSLARQKGGASACESEWGPGPGPGPGPGRAGRALGAFT